MALIKNKNHRGVSVSSAYARITQMQVVFEGTPTLNVHVGVWANKAAHDAGLSSLSRKSITIQMKDAPSLLKNAGKSLRKELYKMIGKNIPDIDWDWSGAANDNGS